MSDSEGELSVTRLETPGQVRVGHEGELSVTGQKEGKTTSWQLESTPRELGDKSGTAGLVLPFFPCPVWKRMGE